MSGLRRIALVGRGIIGASWALVFARAGRTVSVWEREGPGESTRARVANLVRNLRGTGLEGDAGTLDRIVVSLTLEQALEGADYVQESVREDIGIKRDLFSRIEPLISPGTIVASSTSGIVPGRLSDAFRNPERFLVVHPLTPPHVLPITEVCASVATNAETVAATEAMLVEVGQRPMRVHAELDGFVLNRILGAVLNEIFALIRDGALAPEDVDAALTEGFGLRWAAIGPLAAMQLNAPGGVREYLKRYGHIFSAAAQSRGARSALDDAVIEQVGAAVDRMMAQGDATALAAARDRSIAMIRKARSAR